VRYLTPILASFTWTGSIVLFAVEIQLELST